MWQIPIRTPSLKCNTQCLICSSNRLSQITLNHIPHYHQLNQLPNYPPITLNQYELYPLLSSTNYPQSITDCLPPHPPVTPTSYQLFPLLPSTNHSFIPNYSIFLTHYFSPHYPPNPLPTSNPITPLTHYLPRISLPP